MPTSYSSPVDEYWSLVNDVTLWDVTCERQIEVTGPDAFRFIQMLTPRDMSKCEVGQCQYMVLTNQDGGIVNDESCCASEKTNIGCHRAMATC